MIGVTIRPESPDDGGKIGRLIERAFAGAPHAGGDEALIVARLRQAGALSVSRVASVGGLPVGHVAASPVTVGGQAGWAGIGPLAVDPAWQGRGIGSALMRAVLAELAAQSLRGAVLVGDPGYYGRFGFRVGTGLTVDPIPARFVQGLAFGGAEPRGAIAYHPAFGLG